MTSEDAAEFVRTLREGAGLTQRELAERVGMSQSAISDYERGRKTPGLSALQRLADVVGADVAVVLAARRRPPTLASLRRRRLAIRDVCARHGATHPRIVGSLARGTAHSRSDVDFVVELERGRTLFDVAALHDALSELLGCEVDVITRGAVRGRLAHLLDGAVPL